jgi:hypothetical protein
MILSTAMYSELRQRRSYCLPKALAGGYGSSMARRCLALQVDRHGGQQGSL